MNFIVNLKKIFKKIMPSAITILVCVLAIVWGGAFFLRTYPVVDFSILGNYNQGLPSILLDDEGKEWARFQLDKRMPVSLFQMPDHLIKSFIAAEDRSFFKHSGLSWRGIIRSTLVNIARGKRAQGASTITQQLIKLLYFDGRKTFSRKLKEQFLSLLVEQQFTKEQILETYLNNIYFGSGIYGVEAAAQRFWGISIEQVSIAQAALLASIIPSPGNYSPLYDPELAVRRRNFVLGQLLKCSFITHDEYEKASVELLNLKVSTDNEIMAPYLYESIRQFLEEKFGKQMVYTGGLSIQTTLNKTIQRKAQKSFYEHYTHELTNKIGQDIQGALLTLEVKTGGVKALIGGVDFKKSPFNRALQGQRQQGSIFKPILYAAAIQHGMTFLDTAIDEPFILQSGNQIWEPHNYHLEHEGSMTLAYALSYSNNIVSAKTILAVGPKKVSELAKKFRIFNALPYPSLALGCVDSSVIQVAGMFNVFANGGVYVEPHFISWIKDRQGKKIYSSVIETERVVDLKVVSQVVRVLSLGMDRRRKLSSEWIDSDAFNKTGTTNDSRICWFGGSTPELTTVIYTGFDNNRPMGKNIFPVHTGYPIWLALHKTIPTTQKCFSVDPSLREVKVNLKTGVVSSCDDDSEVFPLLY